MNSNTIRQNIVFFPKVVQVWRKGITQMLWNKSTLDWPWIALIISRMDIIWQTPVHCHTPGNSDDKWWVCADTAVVTVKLESAGRKDTNHPPRPRFGTHRWPRKFSPSNIDPNVNIHRFVRRCKHTYVHTFIPHTCMHRYTIDTNANICVVGFCTTSRWLSASAR